MATTNPGTRNFKWKRIGKRLYFLRSDGHSAFVFGAPAFFLWAWVVYSRGGKDSGVANGFKNAKASAEGAIPA